MHIHCHLRVLVGLLRCLLREFCYLLALVAELLQIRVLLLSDPLCLKIVQLLALEMPVATKFVVELPAKVYFSLERGPRLLVLVVHFSAPGTHSSETLKLPLN